MAVIFSCAVELSGVFISAQERRLLSRRPVPLEEWPGLSGLQGAAGRVINGLVADGNAVVDQGSVRIDHDAAAALPASLAEALNFPPLAPLSLTLGFNGRIDSEDGTITLRWEDEHTRAVMARRTGAFVEWGKRRGRLSVPTFRLLEAIDAFNRSAGCEIEARIAAWQPVQESLASVTGATVRADDYLQSLTIYQAGTFALDIRETPQGPDFVPVLMSHAKAVSLEDDAPVAEGPDDDPVGPSGLRDQDDDALLPPELQRRFATECFAQIGRTRDAYVLGRNVFVVLEPELKSALDVVRAKRSASPQERREFIRNPRPAIAEALGSDDTEVAAGLFVETHQYSERVLGLGIWDPPRLSWLRRIPHQWLPEQFTIGIGGETIELTSEGFGDLRARLEFALAEQQSSVVVQGRAYPVEEVVNALEAARPILERSDAEVEGSVGDGEPQPPPDRSVLIVQENLEEVQYTARRRNRPVATEIDLPCDLLGETIAKPHQQQGFQWLVEAWARGCPGVLLADDMGLGKTFQALVFLAWLRSNRGAARRAGQGGLSAGPVLVVAPTALLRNWVAESERHLVPEALGERIDAFGRDLARLKRPKGPDWTPEDALDIDALRSAGWILTTYETLADYHRAFARVAYAVAVFDEMQKVKAPGTINTHAAKTLNADFVVGLTGTPIENRIEDLWCIMDRIVPGYLGDLKSFSTRYGDNDRDALKELKAKLDQPLNSAPAIMLRRMKEDILEGLPSKTVEPYQVVMPSEQADAYARVVREAQSGERSRGAMLKVLHALRGISLHPHGAQGLDCYDERSVRDWISRSARIGKVVEILQRIRERGEKALVFIEYREVQSAFAAVAAGLFSLPAEPAVINGTVPGHHRQAIVDRFQASPPGFDLLVLSPKAAGLGLTITAANHVIHLSRWWNPAIEDQCNDRVYRIGQNKPVTIHIPIAVHQQFGEASFDVTLDKLLREKRALSRDMLAPPEQDRDIDALFERTISSARA